VDIEQITFSSYTFTKLVNESTKHVVHGIEYATQFVPDLCFMTS